MRPSSHDRHHRQARPPTLGRQLSCHRMRNPYLMFYLVFPLSFFLGFLYLLPLTPSQNGATGDYCQQLTQKKKITVANYLSEILIFISM
jgi:hypothetical protein